MPFTLVKPLYAAPYRNGLVVCKVQLLLVGQSPLGDVGLVAHHTDVLIVAAVMVTDGIVRALVHTFLSAGALNVI